MHSQNSAIHSPMLILLIMSVLFIGFGSNSVFAQTPEVLNPAGPVADSISNLFYLLIAICSLIFVIVGGALLYFTLRFRERDEGKNSEPAQIYGSQPIELAWTLAPLLIILVLSLVVIRSVIELRAEDPTSESLQVRVVGHQWWWEFEYPQYGFTTANELVIPVGNSIDGRKVYLQLESADVIHSFWVPRLAGKTDLIPGKTNQMWIQTDEPGTYMGRCAEYCGTQHANMLIRVDAVSPADFQKWVSAQQQMVIRPESSHSHNETDQSADSGKARFMELACANCHTIRGTVAEGKFGPDLTHLMSRKTLAAGIVENNIQNLSSWIADPDQFKAGCRMPNMRLSNEDVQQMVTYLETLK